MIIFFLSLIDNNSLVNENKDCVCLPKLVLRKNIRRGVMGDKHILTHTVCVSAFTMRMSLQQCFDSHFIPTWLCFSSFLILSLQSPLCPLSYPITNPPLLPHLPTPLSTIPFMWYIFLHTTEFFGKMTEWFCVNNSLITICSIYS